MRSGSLRVRASECKQSEKSKRCEQAEAKRREEGGREVQADNVVGVACAMTRASSVGNVPQQQGATVSVSYGIWQRIAE